MTTQVQQDIKDMESIISFICNNVGFSDEMQRAISQIELRIMEVKESNDL